MYLKIGCYFFHLREINQPTQGYTDLTTVTKMG